MNFETFDDSYVDRLRAGDAATEQHFVRYFGELMTLKLRSRVRTVEAMEDVKQETFVRVLGLVRSAGGVQQAERLGPLVNAICNNVLQEQYRAVQRVSGLDDEAADRLMEVRPNALSVMISDDTRRVVRLVLDELKERDQRVLRAVFLEERDKDEVCREFGVEREYLRVLLHRAKGSFRTKYRKLVEMKPATKLRQA